MTNQQHNPLDEAPREGTTPSAGSDEQLVAEGPKRRGEQLHALPRESAPQEEPADEATATPSAEVPSEPVSEPVPVAALESQLESQGFTHAEALRLLDISDRLADSHEVRENEAFMRRLRFQRWLVERGLLDEFSA